MRRHAVYKPTVTPANDQSDGNIILDGTRTPLAMTPIAGVYLLSSSSPKADKVVIGAGIRLIAPASKIQCRHLDMSAAASRLDADGNSASSATAGTLTVPRQLLSTNGDLFSIIGAGGAGILATGPGTTATTPGASMVGSCAGRPGAAGAQLAGVNAACPALSLRLKSQFRSRSYGHDCRISTAAGTFVAPSGGQGGQPGSCDITVGTGTSGAGGSGGQCLVIVAEKLTMGAGARISARGGSGGARASQAGGGLVGGGAPGGGGSIWMDIGEMDCHPTATIDCDSGAIGVGSGGATGLSSDPAPPGALVVFLGGKPAPRQRVMVAGDSLAFGATEAPSVMMGGMRGTLLQGLYYRNLSWLYVGNDVGGSFHNNEACGTAGETIEQIAARLVLQVPQHLAHIDGWPDPILVIQMGTNNCDVSYDNVVDPANYLAALNAAWAVNPRIKIILTNVMNNANAAYDANAVLLNAHLLNWSQTHEKVAQGRLFHYDLRARLGVHSVLTYMANDAHPNTTGYYWWADGMRPLMVTVAATP